MEDEKEIPRLLRFLYGEAAEAAEGEASERLMRWAGTFDQWLVEGGRNGSIRARYAGD
jgi:hypothetical protein